MVHFHHLNNQEHAHQAWHQFKEHMNLQFDTEDDHDRAYQNFKDNHDFIRQHNDAFQRGEQAFEVGHNIFSHFSPEEFSSIFKGFDAEHQRANHDSSRFDPNRQTGDIPDSVDWRDQGAVNPVQDQGQCGCCYAFSATATIESQYFRKSGDLVKLSEQNAMDCSTKFGNQGGNGGTMDNVFKSVIHNGGLDTEESYPYEAKAGHCRYNPENSVTTLSGYIDIPQGDEDALTKAVANSGPVSVGIDASQRSFQLYKSGIYNDPNVSDNIDHAVVVVGYGSDNGQDYYIIRNSWGTSWGEQGYVKWPRNQNGFGGITEMASFPTIGSGNGGGN